MEHPATSTTSTGPAAAHQGREREVWSPPRLTRLAAAATASGGDGVVDGGGSAMVS